MAVISTTAGAPYVGPRAFSAGEPIYGRDREIPRLLNLLIAERIVLLYSPSGAGKTSLLQAGLIPRLRDEEFQVLPVARVSLDPAIAVQTGVVANRYILSVLLSLEEALPPEQRLPLAELATFDLTSYLARPTVPPDARPTDRVLLIDQFEEILTVDPTDQRAKIEFFAAIGEALRDRHLWALFALREDYLAGLDPFVRPIPTRLRTTFRLDLLGEEAARSAIQRPARDRSVDFADDAAQKLVDDLRRVRVQRPDGTTDDQLGPYVEPVQLQVVCLRLWEQLPPGVTQIVSTDVASVGDVNEALAAYYAERVAVTASQTGVRERAIRAWIDQRLITASGIRGQVLQGVGESEGLANPAIEALVDAHLVRSERRRGFTWFELAHDRLIGPVRADNARWFQSHLSELQRQAALWDRQDRPTGLLLRGQAFRVAEAWAASHQDELTTTEGEFLTACREADGIARRQRRANLLIRALAVVMTVVSVVAVYFYVQAREQAQIALSRQLIAQGLWLADVQPDLALLVSLEGYRLTPTVETRSGFFSVLASSTPLITYIRGADAPVTSVAFSPDGKVLASAGEDRSIRLWDVASHQEIGTALTGHTAGVTSLAFSPDGKTLASGSADKTIRLWDVATRQLIGSPLTGHGDSVRSVAFSPDGKTLASGSADKTIRLWNVASHQLVGAPFSGHSAAVTSVAFDPDGKTLASGSDDKTIRLWDVATHRSVGTPLSGHTQEVESVAFSPDGKLLASADYDQTIRLWDVANHQPSGLPLVGHTASVRSVVFSPDGKILASASNDNTIRLWDVANRQPLGMPLTGHTAAVASVAFSPDGSILASASNDKTVGLWGTGFPPSLGKPLAGRFSPVWSVAFARDGKTLASADAGGTVRLWDVANRGPRGSALTGHTGSVWAVTFSPDGQIIASAGADKTIRFWNAATGIPIGSPLTGHTGGVRSIAFNPDGKILASVGDDRSIRLWNVASRQPIGGPLTGHSGGIRSVVFSPDGKTLASAGDDQTIRLWDVASHQPSGGPLAEHAGLIYSLAFSPDGKTLVSAGGDRSIHFWDVASRQPVGDPLTGHNGPIWSVAFSPDGKTLASAGDDQTVRLWDIASRQSIGSPLVGHSGAIHAVTFSADGQTLASASDDMSIRLWDVDLNGWIARACATANRNLTSAEWQRYLPNLPYQKTCPGLP